MHLIYIAGPFRGNTPWDVYCNVHEAEMLGLEVAKLGLYPVIPHAMTRNFDKLLTDQFWLDGTLEMMKRCDGLITTPWWNASTGAREEVRVMRDEMHKPIFHDIIQLINWKTLYWSNENTSQSMAQS